MNTTVGISTITKANVSLPLILMDFPVNTWHLIRAHNGLSHSVYLLESGF
jgi:hypothetical protein